MQAAGAILGTAEQLQAEKLTLALLADPEIAAIGADTLARCRNDPVCRLPHARRQLEDAIRKWTASLIMRELAGDPAAPRILWATEPHAHEWGGHCWQGSALAGDNPDVVYRVAFIDGSATHEISGKFPTNGPVDFNIEPLPGQAGVIPPSGSLTGAIGTANGLPLLDTRAIKAAADGAFTIRVGPDVAPCAPNSLQTAPVSLALNFRDIFSDWSQQPVPLTIRRTTALAMPVRSDRQLREDVLRHLPDFLQHWSTFRDRWLGGVPINGCVGPMRRAGNWSCLWVGRFQLQPGEAIILRAARSGARYMGAQLTDPWLVSLPAALRQSSLNPAQAVPDMDGHYRYVIAAEDSGVANWLDTGGSGQGFILLRWQLFGDDLDPDRLVSDFRKIDFAAIPRDGMALAGPEARRAAMQQRATLYQQRLA